MTVLCLALVLLVFAHLSIGKFDVPMKAIPEYLISDDGSDAAFVLREIRLPRALAAILVGGALGLSGLLIQIITRNPLGDPGLTGVSAGAALGVAIAITGMSSSVFVVLPMGIAGGAMAATLTFLLARGAGFEGLHLVLAGLAVSLFFTGATGAAMYLNESSMQTLFFWMIGGFSGRGWAEVAMLAPFAICAAVVAWMIAPVLSVLRLDDPVARGLGLATGQWRLLIAGLSVLLAAASVAVAGPIAFVGFLAPHIVRGALQSIDRGDVATSILVPMTALTGGILTLTADLAARAIPTWSNIPAGIWITLLGGMFFLILAPRIADKAAP